MIAQIVGRCHVGERYSEVLRYLISRLRHGKRTWRAMDRARRREVLRILVDEHDENREVYAQVMYHRSWK
jgi:acyl-CoA reductase-like NAD-dependent aldehyde dehydrogenase